METPVGKMVLLLLYEEENIRGGWGIEYGEQQGSSTPSVTKCTLEKSA